jgi:uncharacterized membrane protein
MPRVHDEEGPVLLADVSDTAYDITLILHILCAIVGFGAVLLNGIYGKQVQARRGKEGLAIFQANKLVSHIGQYFIYAVFVFGILLVLQADEAYDFDQTWIWLAIVLFLAAIGVSHGLLQPRVNRMEQIMIGMADGGPPAAGEGGGPPPQAAEMEGLGKQVGMISVVLQILLVAILTLMVTKPGI